MTVPFQVIPLAFLVALVASFLSQAVLAQKTRIKQILDSRMRVGRGLSLTGLLTIIALALILIPGAGRPGSKNLNVIGDGSSLNIAAIPSPASAGLEPTTAPTSLNQQKDSQPQESELKNTSLDQQESEDQTEPNPKQGPPENLLLSVVDEDGNPVEGVNFFVNAGTKTLMIPKVINKNFISNKDGIATLELPDPLTSSRIWASKSGWVTLFFSWEDGETDSMPSEYSLILQRGTELGGVVVDSEGNPVVGARLDVMRAGGGRKVDPQERTRLGTWLANGDDMAITDKDGNWSISNVPKGTDLQFRFLIEHPDFIKDKARHSMGHYRVTLDQLRDKTAKFELNQGVPIRGNITDDKGNPITNGLVIWGDRPYWEEGSQEVKIDQDGKFIVPPQPPGEVRLTVAAPGWMPVDRVVSLSSETKAATENFALKPGKKLHLKFEDVEGNPIPNVYIGVEEWHGKNALYNNRHPNVKNTEIPRASDKEGNYIWDWAPDDLIKLRFGIRDWKYSKTIDIVATGETQTMTLKRPFALSGTVVDAKTGKPVDDYSIIPVTYSSASKSARGIAQQSSQKSFHSSNFTFDDAFQHDDGRLVAFRFQAVGYRDHTTEKFSSDSTNLNTTIALEPASIRMVRALNADGQPATSAKVWVAKPDQGTMVNQIGDYFSRHERGFDVNGNGEVQYGAPGTRHAIVVASRDGYAEKYLDVDEKPGELKLKPWARLEGTLFQAGEPVSGASVIVRPIRQLGGDHPHVQDIFQSTTDAKGRFVFEKLPPLPAVVRSVLSPWRDFPITSSRQLPVELQPGRTHLVSLGGEGMQVVGKVKLLGDNADQIQFRYGLNSMLRLEGGVSTPDHAQHELEFEAGEAKEWNDKLTHSLAPNVTRESFFVKLRKDGSFLISGVQPGRYRFLIKLYEPPTGCLVEPVGYGYLEFSTKDYPAKDNQLDLGTMDVKLKPIPKVGDVLPDFRYQDLNGKSHQISELRGKYVLIDFWASWCKPCLKAFPDLATLHKSIASDDNVDMISVSVDEDLSAAKTAVLKHKIDWAVGFAGKSAGQGESANVLGVSTVPTYLVLDPKGKIIYRGFSHEEAAKLLPNKDD